MRDTFSLGLTVTLRERCTLRELFFSLRDNYSERLLSGTTITKELTQGGYQATARHHQVSC